MWGAKPERLLGLHSKLIDWHSASALKGIWVKWSGLSELPGDRPGRRNVLMPKMIFDPPVLRPATPELHKAHKTKDAERDK